MMQFMKISVNSTVSTIQDLLDINSVTYFESINSVFIEVFLTKTKVEEENTKMKQMVSKEIWDGMNTTNPIELLCCNLSWFQHQTFGVSVKKLYA